MAIFEPTDNIILFVIVMIDPITPFQLNNNTHGRQRWPSLQSENQHPDFGQ